MRGVILMGAPGSGKGTQAKRLVDRYGFAHISTGDMLRGEVTAGSELGKRVQTIMDSGKYVDDSLMIEIIDRRFSEPDVQSGFILDGFPRTLDQGKALAELFQKKRIPDAHIVYLHVDPEKLFGRLTGRVSCPSCGAVFHTSLNPPKQEGVCSDCGHVGLVGRADDSEKTVTKRLNVFETQTGPLLEHYRRLGVLHEFDGSLSVDELSQKIQMLWAPGND